MENWKYKNNNNIDKRILEFKKIKQKYPMRIPVIIEPNWNSKNLKVIDKSKYLVDNELTVAQLLIVIRKRVKIYPKEAIYLFFNNKFYPSSELLKNIYNTEKDEDGFLYTKYITENTFG